MNGYEIRYYKKVFYVACLSIVIEIKMLTRVIKIFTEVIVIEFFNCRHILLNEFYLQSYKKKSIILLYNVVL